MAINPFSLSQALIPGGSGNLVADSKAYKAMRDQQKEQALLDNSVQQAQAVFGGQIGAEDLKVAQSRIAELPSARTMASQQGLTLAELNGRMQAGLSSFIQEQTMKEQVVQQQYAQLQQQQAQIAQQQQQLEAQFAIAQQTGDTLAAQAIQQQYLINQQQQGALTQSQQTLEGQYNELQTSGRQETLSYTLMMNRIQQQRSQIRKSTISQIKAMGQAQSAGPPPKKPPKSDPDPGGIYADESDYGDF